MASTYGTNLKISIFGQSHAPAIGVTMDGLPAGIAIDMKELQAFLDRRAPGRSRCATQRFEADRPEFLCGLVGNVTCGAPLTAIIRNTDRRTSDYDHLKDCPRPGHADYTAHVKYGGYEDFAGGGHFSGRLTAPLCVAGGICMQILRQKGVVISAEILEIGGSRDNLCAVIKDAMRAGDSVGGVIACTANGLPAGIGEPMFDGLENKISQAVFAIPAVKGIAFGSGFDAARMRGSEHNDAFFCEDGRVRTRTNHHGGILGGISSGMPLTFTVAVKPTPSISRPQMSISYDTMDATNLTIGGRHDPCIVPRAVPCVEAAAAIAIYDLWQTANARGERMR